MTTTDPAKPVTLHDTIIQELQDVQQRNRVLQQRLTDAHMAMANQNASSGDIHTIAQYMPQLTLLNNSTSTQAAAVMKIENILDEVAVALGEIARSLAGSQARQEEIASSLDRIAEATERMERRI